ncbi:MAG: hypothetical protein HC876_02295 [Chloroflexaceae bacterium]|nr:hypothetical protein [Chloroflexaceae bacterium]
MTRELEDAANRAPDLSNPEELRKQLDGIRINIERYLTLKSRLQEAQSLNERIESTEEFQKWRSRIDALRQHLANLTPGDVQAYEQLSQELSTTASDMRAVIEQQRAKSPIGNEGISFTLGVSSDVSMALPVALPLPPITGPIDLKTESGRAGLRLHLFAYASYAVVIILLAIAGFNELYMSNDIFGANPWSDYAALLAWGFGSETARSAIMGSIGGGSSTIATPASPPPYDPNSNPNV